jgi:hypothetical protein
MTDGGVDSAPSTVFLHIGCPKSGTSHIQARMSANARIAREQGLHWPMPWSRQVKSVRDLRTVNRENPGDPSGEWAQLAHEVQTHGAPATLISMEWLVGLRPPQMKACLRTLQPARVEVICSARDLLRTLPAQWQESTQNYRRWAWEEYVDAVLGDDTSHPAHREFWRQHDVPQVLARWAESVPWDRIHLVTVPPSHGDPDLLWRRFCSVLLLEPEAFPAPNRSNSSLGVQAARLMARINVAAHSRGIPKDVYIREFKHALSKDILGRRHGGDAPIAVSESTDQWLRVRAERLVSEVEQQPVHVIGDLDDLRPGERLAGRVPSSVSEAELLDTAIATIIDLLEARAHNRPG